MLRALVLALALANLGYFAWTQHWLDDIVGLRAGAGREPERLARQVHPEAVVVLPAAARPGTPSDAVAASPPTMLADATPASDTRCLEAGPYSAAAASAATAAVQAALPAGSWTDVKTETPGTWLVYMGKFANADSMAKKKEELQRIRQLQFQDVQDAPALQPGISLGRHDSRAAADKALTTLALRGVRSARVVELNPPSTSHLLRIEQADAALAARLLALRADGLGQGFTACAGRAN